MRKNYVISFSCDKELISDIDYLYKTFGDDSKRSEVLVKILRPIIPQRSLSISNPVES